MVGATFKPKTSSNDASGSPLTGDAAGEEWYINGAIKDAVPDTADSVPAVDFAGIEGARGAETGGKNGVVAAPAL